MSGNRRSSPVLTRQEEVKLAKGIDFRASLGVGLDYYQLSFIIQRSLLDLVTANPERITSLEKTNQYPSYDYCIRFAKRNNLVLRCISELNKGREQLTEKELREWQHATGLMINENKDIISNPARVLNFVETSFELSAGKTKVLAQKKEDVMYLVSLQVPGITQC